MVELRKFLAETSAISFLDQLEVPAYVVDRERRIVFWNQKAKELTGYTAEEVVGLRCSEQVLNHVDRTGIPVCSTELCPLYQAIKNGVSVEVPFAVYGLTKSGQRRAFSVIGIPIKRNSSAVLGALEIFTDAEKISTDMATAIKIQESFVPPNTDKIEFFYRPSTGLGGDLIYYNPPWLAIVDISGHGIAAALVSMLLRTIFDEVFGKNPALNMIPVLMEKELGNYNLEGLYFTAIVGKIEDSEFRFINVGHPYPINLTNRELILTPTVPPVGFGLSENYGDDIVQAYDLTKGSLLLYTDGLIEMRTKNGILGVEGLLEILEPNDRLANIYLKASLRRTSPIQEDDITMVLLRDK
uniref:PAS domain-containing protein n=1 Tax=Fervidobacterium thailandense TaxID=1008305 RepID=A0A7C4CEJ4_9BACT